MDFEEFFSFLVGRIRFGFELDGGLEISRQKMREQAHTKLIEEMRLHNRDGFFDFFRMSPETFERLFLMVGPCLRREPTLVKEQVPEKHRLELTLRYLAHGDSYEHLENLFHVPESSIGEIIKETSQMLWVILWPHVLETPSMDKWRGIASKMDEQWQLPHILGPLGGRHVIMQTTPNYATNSPGIVFFAACDTQCRFTVIDVGPYAPDANCSPSYIFNGSMLSYDLDRRTLDLPNPELREEIGMVTPYHFAADETFPLKYNILCPVIGKEAAYDECKIYNYRLSRVLQLIENTFAVMSANWRVFKQPIVGDIQTVHQIAKACACLHNFLKSIDDELPELDRKYCPAGLLDTEGENGVVTEGSWRTSEPSKGLLNLSKSGDHNSYWPPEQFKKSQ